MHRLALAALAAVSLACTAPATAHAAAIIFTVNSYTSNSLTFTLSGQMPATAPAALANSPVEIDINYGGTLYTGDGSYHANALSAAPLIGVSFSHGNTGGFGDTPTNYSWLYFTSSLEALSGTNSQVTLTWGGALLLNTSGTGSFDLYWANLASGPELYGSP